MVGKTLGHYRIVEQIGAGGMGEVYKATDTRLDRTVAIKVLPAHVASDPDLRQRFEREAKTISSLNHPHICTLHDIGTKEGTDFLVMEYLEGETLAQRLTKGALPLVQALRYAVEIADALDKAHRQGITHRDLKPGNIMITKAGTKLLDFGLAKLKQPAVGAPGMSTVPTRSAGLTVQGTILGTLQYMAPEQLEGAEADARTDIFAFGAVLYEMLTGRRAFEGKSQASLMAAIIDRDPPPPSILQPLIPGQLDHLVSRCIAKSPDDRWQTVHDVTLQLRWSAEQGVQSWAGVPSQRASRRAKLAWVAAAVGLVAVLGVFWMSTRSPAVSVTGPPVSFALTAPSGSTFTPTESAGAPHIAVSPEGRRLAFVAAGAGRQSLLWVHSLESRAAQVLPGTEDAAFPFWSPDGQSLGFFADGKLKKAEIFGGGLPQVLCEALQGRGGTWNRDGVILFAPNINDPLYRISASGGVPVPVTTLDSSQQETSHRWPSFLPDGRQFVYFVRNATAVNSGVAIGSLDSAETLWLLNTDARAAFAPSAHLMFEQRGTLMVQSFSARTGGLAGEPVVVAESVSHSPDLNYAAFSVSRTGVLAYGGQMITPTTELVWFDRRGRRLESVGPPGAYSSPWGSPDERQLAVARFDPQTGTRDIWLLDRPGGRESRFTFHPSDDTQPLWSPDGKFIGFRSNRDGHGSFYRKASTGAGDEEQVLASDTGVFPTDWSQDGERLVFQSPGAKTGWDLWVLGLGDRRAVPFLQTRFNEMHGRLSPDGRWMAYSSDELGRREIYVEPFPRTGGRWQISQTGGSEPHWQRDGKELFYLTADRTLVAVPVAGVERLEVGIATPLFEAQPATITAPFETNYAPSADGQRFLVNTVVETATSPPITVVVNWTAELEP